MMDPNVDAAEIERIAALMRIDVGDNKSYLDGIREMISFFMKLDEADTTEEEIMPRVMTMTDLRSDTHRAEGEGPPDIVEALHGLRNGYVRAPSPA